MRLAQPLLLGAIALTIFFINASCIQPNVGIDLPGETNGTITHQGHDRTYQVFVPTTYDGTTIPLVMVFHERNANGRQISRTTGFNALAEREKFIVAYPNAIKGVWNDGRPSGDAAIDDVGFTRALIDRLVSEFEIDTNRIYATGYSNGGHMVNRLVIQLENTFAAAAPVASLLSSDPTFLSPPPQTNTPILIIHGTSDPVTPFMGGMISGNIGTAFSATDTINFWVTANNASTEPAFEDLPDNEPADGTRARRETHAPLTSQGAEVQFIIIEGGGHTWAGVENPLPSLFIGATCRDFSATEEIWSFFSRHHR